MPFLQSLICYQGKDNGRRFLAIQLGGYLLLALIASVLAKAVVLQVLILLTLLPLVSLSALRRIKDAEAPLLMTLIFPLFFVITDLTLSYLDSVWRWAVLVLPILSSLAGSLLANPNRRGHAEYLWGYNGPANRDGHQLDRQSRLSRVEPTLTPEAKLDDLKVFDRTQFTSAEQQSTAANSTPQINFDLPEALLKYRLPIVISAILISLAVLWFALGDNSKAEIENAEVKNKPAAEMTFIAKERIQKTEMPDSFWIMLDQNDALSIAWQGDTNMDGDYWNAYTGKGDKTCTEVDFSIGDSYRTLRVEVKNGGDYYADFSPVDTDKLVHEIALKDRFKLCGYEFSLKGTQALLMSRPAFRKILQQAQ